MLNLKESNDMYEIKLTYTTVDDKGNDKTVRESFIVGNAELFAEAENAGYKYGNGLTDIDVVEVKRSRLKEIANKRTQDCEKIFLATLVDVFLCDDGSEKETKYDIAFFSKDMDSAHAYIKSYASQGYNMAVTKIVESKFIDVL